MATCWRRLNGVGCVPSPGTLRLSRVRGRASNWCTDRTYDCRQTGERTESRGAGDEHGQLTSCTFPQVSAALSC